MSFITYKANEQLFKDVVFDADYNSPAYPLTSFKNAGIVLSWDNLTGTINGTYVVEVSNDSVIWDTLTTPIAFAGATSYDAISISDCNFAYLRLKCTKTGITGGTISANITVKN